MKQFEVTMQIETDRDLDAAAIKIRITNALDDYFFSAPHIGYNKIEVEEQSAKGGPHRATGLTLDDEDEAGPHQPEGGHIKDEG